MTKEEFIEEYFVLCLDVSRTNGAFIIDGKWYAPKYGCDTVEMMIDNLTVGVSCSAYDKRGAICDHARVLCTNPFNFCIYKEIPAQDKTIKAAQSVPLKKIDSDALFGDVEQGGTN